MPIQIRWCIFCACSSDYSLPAVTRTAKAIACICEVLPQASPPRGLYRPQAIDGLFLPRPESKPRPVKVSATRCAKSKPDSQSPLTTGQFFRARTEQSQFAFSSHLVDADLPRVHSLSVNDDLPRADRLPANRLSRLPFSSRPALVRMTLIRVGSSVLNSGGDLLLEPVSRPEKKPNYY